MALFGGSEEPNHPTEFDWYDVYAWERDFCKQWGGVQMAGVSTQGNAKTNSDIPLSVAVMTIQAEKEVLSANLTNYTMYKVAYYMRPGNGTWQYAVRAVGNSGLIKQIIGKTSVSSMSPASGYIAWESLDNETYSIVQMRYEDGKGEYNEIFTAPFVDEDYNFDDPCTTCGTSGGGASAGGGWTGW